MAQRFSQKELNIINELIDNGQLDGDQAINTIVRGHAVTIDNMIDMAWGGHERATDFLLKLASPERDQYFPGLLRSVQADFGPVFSPEEGETAKIMEFDPKNMDPFSISPRAIGFFGEAAHHWKELFGCAIGNTNFETRNLLFTSGLWAGRVLRNALGATANTLAGIGNLNRPVQIAYRTGVTALAGSSILFTALPVQARYEVPLAQYTAANTINISCVDQAPGPYYAERTVFSDYLRTKRGMSETNPYYIGMQAYFDQAEHTGKLTDPRLAMGLNSAETGQDSIQPGKGTARGFFQQIIPTAYQQFSQYIEDTQIYADLKKKVESGNASRDEVAIHNAVNTELAIYRGERSFYDKISKKSYSGRAYAQYVSDVSSRTRRGNLSAEADRFLGLRTAPIAFQIFHEHLGDENPEFVIKNDPETNEAALRKGFAKAQGPHFLGPKGYELFDIMVRQHGNTRLNDKAAIQNVITANPSMKGVSSGYFIAVASSNPWLKSNYTFKEAEEKRQDYLWPHMRRYAHALDGVKTFVTPPVCVRQADGAKTVVITEEMPRIQLFWKITSQSVSDAKESLSGIAENRFAQRVVSIASSFNTSNEKAAKKPAAPVMQVEYEPT